MPDAYYLGNSARGVTTESKAICHVCFRLLRCALWRPECASPVSVCRFSFRIFAADGTGAAGE
jgi:hypothetical protein